VGARNSRGAYSFILFYFHSENQVEVGYEQNIVIEGDLDCFNSISNPVVGT
jgi:hypothetical protein